MSALQAQAVDLKNIHCLGEEILASCHPDSIITLKSWISVTKTRYEEVSECVHITHFISAVDQIYDKELKYSEECLTKPLLINTGIQFMSEKKIESIQMWQM